MIWLILFVGLLLRLISLNQSFWLDEATSGLVARMSVSEIFQNFLPGDFHPPVYYLILKAWSLFFGTSEIGVRSLSVVAGVLTIYVVYLIGEKIQKSLGLIAGGLLATSGLHIYFSQEARMYSLATFFVSLAVYFFVKTLQEGRVGDWIGFSFGVALASMTHYLALFILPVFWIYGFWVKKEKSWIKKFIVSHNILIISWLLWLPYFLKQLSFGLRVSKDSPLWADVLGKTSLKEILLVPTKFIFGKISFENKGVYGFLVLMAILVFGYLLIKSLKNFRDTKLIWLWLLVPFCGTALLGIVIPVFSYNRLLFILPAFYLLTAYGIKTLKPSLASLVLSGLITLNLVSSLTYLLNPKFHREDWKGLTNFVKSESGSTSSAVVFVANSQMEAYRYYDNAAYILTPKELSSNYDIIWLMRYVQPIFDPSDKVRQDVEKLGYSKQGELDFNGVVVWKYEK